MKGRPVNPRVFAKAATTHVADALFHRTGNGLTFAGMKEFRGLPYKVIAVVGLNRDSAFPGTNTAEEFDLMAPGTSAGMRAVTATAAATTAIFSSTSFLRHGASFTSPMPRGLNVRS